MSETTEVAAHSLRQPSGLTREKIITAALAYIDEHGAQGLTMRNLALDLHVEAMSLYRYVRGREDLLEGVVAELLSGEETGLDDQLVTHWQGFLQTVAHQIRRIAVDHPNAFPLVATRPSAAAQHRVGEHLSDRTHLPRPNRSTSCRCVPVVQQFPSSVN